MYRKQRSCVAARRRSVGKGSCAKLPNQNNSHHHHHQQQQHNAVKLSHAASTVISGANNIK